MKKAKILLGAIAIFGVVGGALAFKAKGTGNIYCGNACEDIKLGFTTTNPGAATATTVCNLTGTNLYYFNANGACTSTTIAYTTAP